MADYAKQFKQIADLVNTGVKVDGFERPWATEDNEFFDLLDQLSYAACDGRYETPAQLDDSDILRLVHANFGVECLKSQVM